MLVLLRKPCEIKIDSNSKPSSNPFSAKSDFQEGMAVSALHWEIVFILVVANAKKSMMYFSFVMKPLYRIPIAPRPSLWSGQPKQSIPTSQFSVKLGKHRPTARSRTKTHRIVSRLRSQPLKDYQCYDGGSSKKWETRDRASFIHWRSHHKSTSSSASSLVSIRLPFCLLSRLSCFALEYRAFASHLHVLCCNDPRPRKSYRRSKRSGSDKQQLLRPSENLCFHLRSSKNHCLRVDRRSHQQNPWCVPGKSIRLRPLSRSRWRLEPFPCLFCYFS